MNTAAAPCDWLSYKPRRKFNLFELACLLNRQDPRRISDAATNEHISRLREMGEAPLATTPQQIAALADTMPELMLGEAVGKTLQALKTATGQQTMSALIGVVKAQRITSELSLEWPLELGTGIVRRDDLDPVIDKVLSTAADPKDYAAIWNGAVDLAKAKRLAPLIGVAEGDLKYETADGVRTISRKAFVARLKRRHAKAR